MMSLLAFMKKEWMELVRSGKLIIFIILFILFGIMNPAIAKLTPWMMEVMAESLEETGLIVTEVYVDALTSWTQFFKNIPIGLISFVLIYSSVLTKEYQSGTLVLVLTKGLSRYKVVIAKSAMMLLVWTSCYWLCYGITYGYNEYFWDNSIADNLVFSVVCWWLMGVLAIALVVFFSAVTNTNTGVMLATGGTFLGAYLLGLLPKLEKYSPTKLMDSASLLYGVEGIGEYKSAIVITIALIVVCISASLPIMNKKRI